MKEKVSPAVAAVIVVVVVAVIGYFGFRTLTGGNRSGVSDSAKPSTTAQTQRMNQQYQNYGQSRGSGGGMGSPYGGGQGMPGSSGANSGDYMNRGGSASPYSGR